VYCSDGDAAALLVEACNTSKPLPSWKVDGGSTRETSGWIMIGMSVGYAESCPSEHAKVREPEARVNPSAGRRSHEAPEGSTLEQLPAVVCRGVVMEQAKPTAVGGTKESVEFMRQRTRRDPLVSV